MVDRVSVTAAVITAVVDAATISRAAADRQVVCRALAAWLMPALLTVACCVGATTVPAMAVDAANGSSPAIRPSAAASSELVDFDTQIIPLLTRFGCNGGACHGAAVGRGGLQLSLYGSRPQLDYEMLALQLEGRRVHRVHPQQSLVWLKATGQLDHGGGQRFAEQTPAAALLLRWIQQGALRRPQRELQQLDVRTVETAVGEKDSAAVATEAEMRMPLTVQLQVLATFQPVSGQSASGAGQRNLPAAADSRAAAAQVDVTDWTVLTADDPAAVQIADNGQVLLHRPGRHIVIARFLNQVVPVELWRPYAAGSAEGTDSADAAQVAAADIGTHLIDREISFTLQRLRLKANPAAAVGTLVRRVTLDLTGRLPTPEQAALFVQSPAADRWSRLLDELLASEAFTDYWTWQLADLLRLGAAGDAAAVAAYHDWLRSRVASRQPLDQLVRELVLAEGTVAESPAVLFHLTGRDAREQAEFVTERLLGLRLRCANCHDHPLDHWTQDDYHGLAAVFVGWERRTADAAGSTVRYTGRGQVQHPGTGLPAVARIPGESGALAPPQESGANVAVDHRLRLVEWLVDARQPLFARAIVNRVWQQLLGRGLVEPVDDLRTTNPATHPELLRTLTQYFVAHDYDLRALLRLVCSSQVYCRSSLQLPHQPPEDRYYVRAARRRLPAAVLLDAISDVTGVPEPWTENSAAGRAIQLSNPQTPSVALDALGRCTNPGTCGGTAAAAADPLAMQLHLINGPVLNHRLSANIGRVAQFVSRQVEDAEFIRRFYWLAFSRDPSAEESAVWQAELQAARRRGDLQSTAEDLVWSLLTSAEFCENH